MCTSVCHASCLARKSKRKHTGSLKERCIYGGRTVLRIVPNEPKKKHDSWHFSASEKSRKTSHFVIVSNCKKIDTLVLQTYLVTVFASGANSREWGTARRAGSGRPRLARPVISSNHVPKPGPACGIPISPTVGQARSARFSSRRPSARPGL